MTNPTPAPERGERPMTTQWHEWIAVLEVIAEKDGHPYRSAKVGELIEALRAMLRRVTPTDSAVGAGERARDLTEQAMLAVQHCDEDPDEDGYCECARVIHDLFESALLRPDSTLPAPGETACPKCGGYTRLTNATLVHEKPCTCPQAPEPETERESGPSAERIRPMREATHTCVFAIGRTPQARGEPDIEAAAIRLAHADGWGSHNIAHDGAPSMDWEEMPEDAKEAYRQDARVGLRHPPGTAGAPIPLLEARDRPGTAGAGERGAGA